MKSFIITGEKPERDKYIKSFIEKEKILPHSITEYLEDIKIKEAREIRISLSKKNSGKKLIIISSKINPAAQNTLLKSFEELPENVAVLISVENINEILDTIKSRLFQVNLNYSFEGRDYENLNLLSSDFSNNLLNIDKFLSNHSKEDPKKLSDRFLLQYRTELINDLENIKKEDLNKYVFILKNLLVNSLLIKNNNLNLRLGLEIAFLK